MLTESGRGSCALLALVALMACNEPPPVIGISTSAPFVEAARMALADARAAGIDVVLDTVVIAESSNEAAPALEASQTFVSTPGIAAVLGHSNSAASLAASQVYNEHRVLQISPTSSAVVYSEAGPYSFRLVPPDDRQGRFLAGVLRDSLPSDSRVALLYVNDDYGRGLRAALLEALTEMGEPVEVVVDLPHVDGGVGEEVATDHLIDAVAAARTSVLVWLGRPSTLDQILPAVRARLGSIPIYGGDAVSNGRQMPNLDGRWTGVRFVDFVDLGATEESRTFADRYRERFGLEPSGPEALTYDAMGILLSALREGAETGSEIRAHLLSLGNARPPYEGVTGPIQFDERGDVRRSYHLGVVRDR